MAGVRNKRKRNQRIPWWQKAPGTCHAPQWQSNIPQNHLEKNGQGSLVSSGGTVSYNKTTYITACKKKNKSLLPPFRTVGLAFRTPSLNLSPPEGDLPQQPSWIGNEELEETAGAKNGRKHRGMKDSRDGQKSKREKGRKRGEREGEVAMYLRWSHSEWRL